MRLESGWLLDAIKGIGPHLLLSSQTTLKLSVSYSNQNAIIQSGYTAKRRKDMTFEEVFGSFSWQAFVHVVVRMGFAILLGGIIGYERETTGKPAGIRTHILVCLGTAFFIFPSQITAMSDDGLSRIIQGIGAGVGFLGAGT